MSEPSSQAISAAAHAALSHANPLATAQMGELVAHALAAAPRTAVEVGCGPGTFSVELARRAAVAVTAYDTNPHFLERARALAERTPLRGSVVFEEREAAACAGSTPDLIVCIGASQAFGPPREALDALARLLRPGAGLVFAELVWAATPPADFVTFMGVEPDFCWRAEDTRAVCAAAGFEVAHELSAAPEAFAAYEEGVLAGRCALAETLEEAAAAALRSRAHAWYAAWQEHGHACLGFTACVARRL